ncbi:MAG: Gfo/Idh/MocA family oxidoreductase [Clostridia bacterium]|nr:Gfo/Idh/MocA family oxidoreductase [Clostridia bacterium]
MKKIRMGVIGLGKRGQSIMKDVILGFNDVDVVALCDEYQDRVEEANAAVKEARGHDAEIMTTDYRDVLNKDVVDAVYVATSWETHFAITIAAMRLGIPVAMEVGGACDLRECNDLVAAYEETGTPIMLMENCCFGADELMATAMVRDGVLGEVVHCEGAYGHDLREEVAKGKERRHYRQRHYIARNAENYPTHELGPIARLLNINRGNRFLSLTSMASKAAGMKAYLEKHNYEMDETLRGVEFTQGDIVTTTIKCAGGQTITIKLDTTLPRFYGREFTVRGTEGYYAADTGTVFIDGMEESFETLEMQKKYIGNNEQYKADYMPDMWINITEEQKIKGHGGIDYFEFKAFFEALKENKPMPIDVYDAASWMCITCLSEASIAMGGQPVAIPDFTNGAWVGRKPEDVIPLGKKSKLSNQ